MAQFDESTEYEEYETTTDYRDRIQIEGDPRAFLLPIVAHIRDQVSEIRKRLKKQTSGTRGKRKRHDETSVEDTATTKYRERKKQGHGTDYDDQEVDEEARANIERDLIVDKDYPEDTAREIANAVLDRKRKVVFLTKSMEGYAFFNVEHKQGGLTEVVFNTNHPLYEQLLEALEPEIEEETDKDLIDRVNKAADTIKLLFSAWARYEMEEVQHNQLLFDVRQEWGKMARFFLSESLD